MRRDTLRGLIGTNGARGRRILAILRKNRIHHVRTHRKFVYGPSEQGLIELFGCILVAGCKLRPAESALAARFDLRHEVEYIVIARRYLGGGAFELGAGIVSMVSGSISSVRVPSGSYKLH